MESYFLKSGIILVCFYVIYWLLVRHNHQFNLNRIIVLFSVIVSACLPLISFDLFKIEGSQLAHNLQPIIISSIENPLIFDASHNSYSIFSIVYIMGLLVVSIRSLTGVATLVYFYWRYPKKRYYGFNAVIIRGNNSPFTFFNILFINAEDFKKDKVDELLIHEQAHRDQFHSFDLILMEIFAAVFWFNPFIWLFKYDLKSEHEFKADEQVIKKGYDKSGYQTLLLKSHEGIALYLANNFNYSILKKRLIMMTKQNSNHLLRINYVLALPVFLATTMILFFNFQLEGQISATPDVMPEYKSGNAAFHFAIQKEIRYPLEARENNIQGTVYISFTVNKNGAIEDIKAEDEKYHLLSEIVVVGYANQGTPDKVSNELSILEKEGERVIALLEEFKPGQKDSKPINTRVTLPITFKID